LKELQKKNYKVIVKNAISIKLLGMGDARYRSIKSNLTEALQHSLIPAHIEEIMDLDSILQYHIAAVPAIIVDAKVIFEHGDIPSTEQLEKMLMEVFEEEADL